MIHTYLTHKWSARRHAWKSFAIALLLAAVSLSCKKQTLQEGNPVMLQVINTVEGGEYLYANLTGTHPIRYANALLIGNPSWNRLTFTAASQPIAFYTQADTLPESKPVWNRTLEVVPGKIYSLFLTGETKSISHILTENIIPPYSKTDSMANVRFAHMYNGQPVSINLKGQPAGSLVKSIAYKEVTAYSALSANSSVDSYEFEFRNATTGELLGSFLVPDVNDYTYSTYYINASFTLVITAQPGGSGANTLKATRVDNR